MDLQSQIREHAERLSNLNQEAIREEFLQFAGAQYDKASTYVNLVIVAGYAGFLTVWNGVRTELTPFELRLSGAAIAVSLAAFVFWEVFVMLYAAQSLRSFAKVIEAKPHEFAVRFKENQRYQALAAVTVRRFWLAALVLTLLPGLVAAGVLMYALIGSLFQG